jgi:hypothetical protein
LPLQVVDKGEVAGVIGNLPLERRHPERVVLADILFAALAGGAATGLDARLAGSVWRYPLALRLPGSCAAAP